ncbi:MAG: exodeoxyribonuclease VII large subunit, partial [Candidatus Eisenbacteria bacterium]|nr:exodeoxyribonuclease VII large subunit [Candidatus Eisenbacteria bacterium]
PIRILLRPTLVQGPEAAPDIARAIAELNSRDDIDLLIVGRGGGSLEDLWAFNEEAVARAIAASRLPVVSAVGHEIDETIADFAADLRAPTPSAAAELAVPDIRETVAAARAVRQRARRALLRLLGEARLRLRSIERSHALKSPRDRLRQNAQRADELLGRIELEARRALRAAGERRERLVERIARSAAQGLLLARQRLAHAQARIEALSPRAVLERGYALAFDGAGRLVASAASAAPGEELRLVLRDGALRCRVEARES